MLPWPRRQSASGTRNPPAARRVDDTPQRLLYPATCYGQRLEAWTTSRVVETIVVIEATTGRCVKLAAMASHHHTPSTADFGYEGVSLRRLQALLERCSLAGRGLLYFSSRSARFDRCCHQWTDRCMANARTIWLPTFGDTLENSRVGHPAYFCPGSRSEIFQLGPQEGVNHLIQRSPRELFPTHLSVSDEILREEYQAASNAWV